MSREDMLETIIRKYAMMVEECEGVDFIAPGCRDAAAKAQLYGRSKPFTDEEWAELVRLTDLDREDSDQTTYHEHYGEGV